MNYSLRLISLPILLKMYFLYFSFTIVTINLKPIDLTLSSTENLLMRMYISKIIKQSRFPNQHSSARYKIPHFSLTVSIKTRGKFLLSYNLVSSHSLSDIKRGTFFLTQYDQLFLSHFQFHFHTAASAVSLGIVFCLLGTSFL